MTMDLSILENNLKNKNINPTGFRKHTKASELYVDVEFIYNNNYKWVGSIPFFYRHTGLFIETEKDLSDYLNEIYPLFSPEKVQKWVEKEKRYWNDEHSGKEVTKPFFDVLINLKWNSVKYDFPSNPNWARRIQDIKEIGYTLATDTRRKVKGKNENDTHIILIPLPRGGATGYEIMSKDFIYKAIKILDSTNCYEVSKANIHGLLPDHKFPEIRWDSNTRQNNLEDMDISDIKNKFQLLDNQRNQQKREICRHCFQTGERGILYGIIFFYKGGPHWPSSTPRIGISAENGCIGCGWYDIQEWREQLNKLLSKLLK